MMKFSKTASVEELQVIGRFESLRKILTSEQYADHRKKPLAYWALPTDRRLPLAFLGRTLEDLLSTPFTELSNTPGIGQKKMCSFVKLLARAANTDPSELPTECARTARRRATPRQWGRRADGNGFNPSAISEVVWSQWRATVVNRGLGDENLGRFAPSLQHMTRVIWNTPLEAYVNYTLADMRALKTHGEKRIRAILEVFHSLHVVMANVGAQDHLVVRIVPRLIDEVEQWVGRALQTPGVPSQEEIYAHFVRPASGTGPHRRRPADRHPGREPPGNRRADHQRSPGVAGHGVDPGPGLPTAQRDQRHHDRPLADGPAPGV